MPANQASLAVTDRYQQRLLDLHTAAGRLATTDWRLVSVDNLDATHPQFVQRLAIGLSTLQAAGVRLTVAYLTAYLTSELGKHSAAPVLDEARYVGVSRSGKTIAESLVSTVITVKKAIGDGVDPSQAATRGQEQARRMAVTETLSSARSALADAIASDDRIAGWRRVTHGGCGACLAAATHPYHKHEPLRVHDGCRCGSEPIVRGVGDHARRPDGHDLFRRMTPEQQDQLLGHDKAELIRSGRAQMRDLIAVSPMVAVPDEITEAPLKHVQAQTA